mgnify:FL=1
MLEQSIPAAELVDKGTVIDLVVGRATVAQTTTTTSTTTTTTIAPTLPPTTPAPTPPPG